MPCTLSRPLRRVDEDPHGGAGLLGGAALYGDHGGVVVELSADVVQQLDAPIVLIWDNLNVHKDRRMRAFIDAQDWLTAYHLPSYAPDLNPVEGIWSVLRRTTQANTAFTDPS